MPKISAGLLMFRGDATACELLLAHPGGPYFKKRDEGHWTIPKGLVEPEEDYLLAAQREFKEETGLDPQEPFLPLPQVRYRSTGKYLHAWAFRGEWLPEQGFRSNSFDMEWPPRSGKTQTFPEIDRLEWFTEEQAFAKLHPVQHPLIEALKAHLKEG